MSVYLYRVGRAFPLSAPYHVTPLYGTQSAFAVFPILENYDLYRSSIQYCVFSIIIYSQLTLYLERCTKGFTMWSTFILRIIPLKGVILLSPIFHKKNKSLESWSSLSKRAKLIGDKAGTPVSTCPHTWLEGRLGDHHSDLLDLWLGVKICTEIDSPKNLSWKYTKTIRPFISGHVATGCCKVDPAMKFHGLKLWNKTALNCKLSFICAKFPLFYLS